MKLFLITITYFLFTQSSYAQYADSLTAKDYANAEQYLSYNTQKYIDHDMGRPHWLAGDKFWYRVLTPQGQPIYFG